MVLQFYIVIYFIPDWFRLLAFIRHQIFFIWGFYCDKHFLISLINLNKVVPRNTSNAQTVMQKQERYDAWSYSRPMTEALEASWVRWPHEEEQKYAAVTGEKSVSRTE